VSAVQVKALTALINAKKLFNSQHIFTNLHSLSLPVSGVIPPCRHFFSCWA